MVTDRLSADSPAWDQLPIAVFAKAPQAGAVNGDSSQRTKVGG